MGVMDLCPPLLVALATGLPTNDRDGLGQGCSQSKNEIMQRRK